MGSQIELMGFLAEIPQSCDLPVDANVSIFQRKREELMLGPLSFVNHSCYPNVTYSINQDESMSLRPLRAIKIGEELTVNYGPEYFGDQNKDCLCPHVEFHGNRIVVFNSRTRSEARKTDEKGRIVKSEFKKVRKSAGPSCPPRSGPLKSVSQSRTSKRPTYRAGL